MIDTPLNLDTVKAELRKLGITITPSAGEYVVNFRDGKESTAIITDNLEAALEHGRRMAALLAAKPERPVSAPGKKHRRLRRMTPKAQRRRFFREHARRLRARTLRGKQKTAE